MAESQLECLEDGLMPAEVPESSPRFYYSERQREALEELLKHGDGAFKSLLQKEQSRDFLSARELKIITNTFRTYERLQEQQDEQKQGKKEEEKKEEEEKEQGKKEQGKKEQGKKEQGKKEQGKKKEGKKKEGKKEQGKKKEEEKKEEGEKKEQGKKKEEEEKKEQGKKEEEEEEEKLSLRSTYWPQVSDTHVPALDIGWTTSGLFRGALRVTVHTHPPKGNSPHIKEVVRKLIQESCKVIAIVMDLLTDLQILQDLFEASKRGVSVYIVLDLHGSAHFLDMCNRLQVGARDLQNVRTRTVKGIGMNVSSGIIPGSVQSKYMLIDGDKVMFGTYSFSWICSRMDRNMIIVMSGPVVDFYDNDFRELYAISDELNLFKEFHLTKPQTGTLSQAAVPKRPGYATSRFQVNLGDTSRGNIPAHKYHNPKYLLALGQIPEPSTPVQDFLNAMEPPVPGQQDPDEELENPTLDPSQSGTEESRDVQKHAKKTRWNWTFKRKPKVQNDAEKLDPTHTDDTSKNTHAKDDTSKNTHAKDDTSKNTHAKDDTSKNTHAKDDTSKNTHAADENSMKNDTVKKKKRGLFKKAK